MQTYLTGAHLEQEDKYDPDFVLFLGTCYPLFKHFFSRMKHYLILPLNVAGLEACLRFGFETIGTRAGCSFHCQKEPSASHFFLHSKSDIKRIKNKTEKYFYQAVRTVKLMFDVFVHQTYSFWLIKFSTDIWNANILCSIRVTCFEKNKIL